MSNSDNRKNKRYVVEGLQGNLMYTSDLEILNISIDGAAIETTKRLELNREYSFKIQYNNTLLTLRGQVVWAVLLSKKRGRESFRPIYRAGIQFIDTLNEKARILHRFIEENKIRTLENRLGGVRFKISNPEDVKIDLPQKYTVRKISISGMLVETAYPLEVNAHYDIELFLNETLVNILVRIINCAKKDSVKLTRYDIGIEFVTMSERDREALQQFMRTFEE
jgi:hypothetical protein